MGILFYYKNDIITLCIFLAMKLSLQVDLFGNEIISPSRSLKPFPTILKYIVVMSNITLVIDYRA